MTFLLLISLVIFLSRSAFFRITNIVCEKDNLPCNEQEKNIFLNFFGQNILGFEPNKKNNQIKQQQPQLGKITYQKIWPNKLVIKITSRIPFASLTVNEKDWYSIDIDGYIFDKKQETEADLPQIISQNNDLDLKPGKIDSSLITISLTIIESLKENLIDLEKIVLNNRQEATLYLASPVIATLSARKDVSMQVDSLQFILRQSKIEGNLPRFIDLRFDKPIMIY